MRDRGRARAGMAVLLLSVAVGMLSVIQPPIQFSGVTLGQEETRIFVESVDPASPAAGVIEPGMRVLEINTRPVDSVDDVDLEELDRFLSGDFLQLAAENEAGERVEMTFPLESGNRIDFFFLVALGLAAGMAAWVRRGLAGEGLRPFAIPLAAAAAAPMLLSPVWTSARPLGVAAGILLPSVAMAVLADGLLARIALPKARTIARAVLVLGAVGGPAVLLVIALFGQALMPPRDLALLITLATALLIGLTLVSIAGIVVSTSRVDPRQSMTHRSDGLPIMLAAVTPVVTALSVAYLPLGYGPALPLIWLLGVLVVLQSNARVETLRLQRDTIVAATEAERARLAADLHDDALQQMTVLVRRLDDEGAVADAEIARSIAERLRDVCGDLRLPILDELGAGPALEWLVERVALTAGGEIQLERADTARPPADVELAVFRIAQEALSNAVSHGAPPIQVQYAASADRAELSIVDHGEGIRPESAASAPRSGHYGLLNMRQRAEQIGARIEFGQAPGGGTAIGFRWSPA